VGYSKSKMLSDRFSQSWDDTLLDTLSGGTLTYGEFWRQASKLIRQWRNMGIGPGGKVAIVLPNHSSVMLIYLACLRGGYLAIPINPELVARDQGRLLGLTKPDLVIRDIPIGLAESEEQENQELDTVSVDAGVIMFSSGTTGTPKPIYLQSSSILMAAQSFGLACGMSNKTRLYHILPLYYNAGFLNAFLAPLVMGGKIVEGPRFSAETLLEFWERPSRMGANCLCLTPTIAEALIEVSKFGEKKIDRVATIEDVICSGNRLSPRTRRRFFQSFGVQLMDCYGVTELGGPLTLQTKEALAQGNKSCGTSLRGVEIELRNPGENGGELWVRSEFVMKGYLDGNTFVLPTDDQGYLNTGDLAELHGSELTISGRQDDLIIRGGENIQPISVEDQFMGIEGISDVIAVGEAHDFWGESVTLCVKMGKHIIKEELISRINKHAEQNVSKIYRPDKIVFVKDFPRTIIGKVKRRELINRLSEFSL
jgi:acyl-CoA synthetase (AMP-forming)/AMP-acid ligase II